VTDRNAEQSKGKQEGQACDAGPAVDDPPAGARVALELPAPAIHAPIVCGVIEVRRVYNSADGGGAGTGSLVGVARSTVSSTSRARMSSSWVWLVPGV